MKIIYDGNDFYHEGSKNIFLLEKLSDQTVNVLLKLGFSIFNVEDNICYDKKSHMFRIPAVWESDFSTFNAPFVIEWDEIGCPILQDYQAEKEEDLLPF